MCHKPININKQQGSALVIAIFIIIVMSLLAAALVRMLSSGAESVVYEIRGTRAYAAAQAGLQSGLGEVFRFGPDTRHCDGSAVSSASQTITTETPLNSRVGIAGASGLEDCEISAVTCSDFKHDGVVFYTITSTGTCGDGSDDSRSDNSIFTSRTLQVTARTVIN